MRLFFTNWGLTFIEESIKRIFILYLLNPIDALGVLLIGMRNNKSVLLFFAVSNL